MNPNSERNLLRTGIVVAAALAALALGILGITSRQGLFERKAEYYSIFPDAAGLKVGAGVWLQGVEAGYVSSIEFDVDAEVTRVRVGYRVNERLVPRIGSNTRATIRNQGLLGDKFVSLVVPPDASPAKVNILPGGEIPIDPSINLEALGRGAQDVMMNLVQVSENLNNLVRDLNQGDGVVSRLLKDPKVGKDTVDHLASISHNLDSVTTALARGDGLAGRLLSDRAYGDQTSRDLSESLRRISQILADVQAGRGGMGQLVAQGASGEVAVKDLAKAAEGLAAVSAALQKPGTLGNRLLVDDVYGQELASNLLSISGSLASILKKVDHGEGTLGALINDRGVYDSLAASAEGMQKSGLVRWYLQKKAEDAARAAQKSETQKKVPE